MAQVELTRHLKEIFPALSGAPFQMEAATIAEVVAELEQIAPGVAFYICDERGRLRQHVNIFIGDEMICDRGKLGDRLEAESRVFIAQALSGG
jgi:molybdopterin synthase sulfur carrier subunit